MEPKDTAEVPYSIVHVIEELEDLCERFSVVSSGLQHKVIGDQLVVPAGDKASSVSGGLLVRLYDVIYNLQNRVSELEEINLRL